jgi:hypothetical protein
MMARGRPPVERARILQRAEQMLMLDGRINKSRIARELHVNIRTVFRVLPGVSI